ESRAKQFPHLLCDRRREGDGFACDGIADFDRLCCWTRTRGRLDIIPDQLSLFARQDKRSLVRTSLGLRFGCFTALVVTGLLGACDLIEPCYVQLERDDLALQRRDLRFERLDLREDNGRANAAHDDENTKQREQPALDVSRRASGGLG